jgi:hypothetical protein
MKNIELAIIERSLDFATYQALFAEASPAYTDKQTSFLPLNARRMDRLLKKDRTLAKAVEQIQQISRPLHILVITEPWCGDAAQIIPPLLQLIEKNEQISLSFSLRDQEPKLIDAFLTNGNRAIPIVIVLDPQKEYEVMGAWGPRPTEAQHMMLQGLNQWRQMPDGPDKKAFYDKLYVDLQKWYASDKTRATQLELLKVLQTCLTDEVASVG